MPYPLPRHYQPWRDTAFWLLLAWLIPYLALGWALVPALKPSSGADSALRIAAALVVFTWPAFWFWVAWETARWEFPNRLLLLLACAFLGWLG